MSIFFLSVAFFASGASAEDEGFVQTDYWMRNKNHHVDGEIGAMMLCGSIDRMSGLCTSPGKFANCDGGEHSEKVRCSEMKYVGGHSDKMWVIGTDDASTVECDILNGYTAIGACTSTGFADCRCTGGKSEGCEDTEAKHENLLRCAKGADIIATDTIQIDGGEDDDKSADITCPTGYIVYSLCAGGGSDGKTRRCKIENGQSRWKWIGCVRAAGSLEADKGRTIVKVDGFWKDLGTYNEEMTYTVQEGIENSMGQSMSISESASYGFSQNVKVGVSVGWGNNAASAELEAGFSQEFTSSSTSTIETMLTKSKFQSWELPCGGSTSGFETIYQWWMTTKTADNRDGPVFKTKKFLCVEGTPRSPSRPRCAPEYCENHHRCDVCEYDYCEIQAVEEERDGVNTAFHFNKVCVNRKLARDDWGEDSRVPEYYTTEHTRQGVILEISQTNLWQIKHPNATEETGGDAWGAWAGEARSEWKAGDKFRVLTFELEEQLSAAPVSAPGALMAAAIGLFSVILATF